MNSGVIVAIGFGGRSGTTEPSGMSCVGGPNGWKFVGGNDGGVARAKPASLNAVAAATTPAHSAKRRFRQAAAIARRGTIIRYIDPREAEYLAPFTPALIAGFPAQAGRRRSMHFRRRTVTAHDAPAAAAGIATCGASRTPMAGRIRSLYLAYFSKPKQNRLLYKLLRKQPVRRITELGIGTGERTLRMLELCPGGDETHYAGIDMFEARSNGDGPGLALKAAHSLLATTGVKVRLVPGDPMSALSRTANSLARQDLIIISAYQDRESLAKAWFYVPRMLHETTVVLLEEPAEEGTTLRRVSHEEIAKLATPPKGRRAA
jgi:predicted O-methyltransferase YrrM